jgi:hypothetical protein
MFYYRNSRGGNRRPRGIYGFPWWLFFIFFFNFHSIAWFVISIGIIVMVSLLIRAATSSGSNAGARSSQMQQTPYYQPKQQYYQPPAQTQQPYQSYEQGYQPARETYNEGNQQYQYPEAAEYDQYEQPQAQYPEEMPPQR